MLENIPLDQILEGESNLRKVDVNSVDFKLLADSIQSDGLLNPISVYKWVETNPENPEEVTFDGFKIVDGLHRLYACRELGLQTIACNIIEVKDADDLTKKQITGNLQRIETKPAEYAAKLREMQERRPTTSLAEFASELNVTEDFLRRRLKLLGLIEEAKEMVDAGEIKVGNATKLATLPIGEQADWLEQARTLGKDEFTPLVEGRMKEIRQERMNYRKEHPVEFEPKARLRKIAEINEQIETPRDIISILSAQGVEDPTEIARETLKWVLHMDDASVTEQRESYEAKKKAREEEKARKKAERDAAKKAKFDAEQTEGSVEEAVA